MKYAYLVYDDIHGLQYICASPETATEKVSNIAFNIYELPKGTSLDYDDEEQWGWDSVAWWVREEVIQ